jgi:undecaprenyl-diphosphatase
MSILHVVILAIVQGLAELLPVSSSAHVVVAEKLLGLDPSSPPMTLLLVMLHTGTMFAVIAYFWRQWRGTYFSSVAAFKAVAGRIILATLVTAIVGEIIIKILERTALRDVPHSEIEDLFSHLEFIAPALAAAGILILAAGLRERRRPSQAPAATIGAARAGVGTAAEAGAGTGGLSVNHAGIIGFVQGLCLPFRGFSRSGATISSGMLLGVSKPLAERFSFALAVVLTPPVVVREVLRLRHAPDLHAGELSSVALISLLGAFLAFLAGLLALKWLSRWLESGRWYLFGIYCLIASVAVTLLHRAGY